MDARLQLRVQRYGWDKAMPFYERGWKLALKPAQDLLMEMADLQEGQKVLDNSCGTGIVSFQAAAAVGATGHVTGVDISDKMVEKCTEAAAEMGFANMDFGRMEAEALDLPDNEFDIVLNGLGFMYYPDPKVAMQETCRVLKPGGKAVSAVWGARSGCGWAEIFPVVDARVSSEVCPMFFILGTGDSLANLYEEVGFKEVQAKRIHTTIHYASDEEALNASFAGGPVAMAYARFDEETKASAHEEYLASIAQYKREGEYYIPGEFVVVSGLKA